MMHDWHTRVRFAVFRVLVVAAFAIIAIKLWELQIVSSQDYQVQADENRFRLVPIDAARGVLFDRNHHQLVRNVPSFTVSIIRAALPDDPDAERAVLERVGELLKMPVDPEEAMAMRAVTAPPPEQSGSGDDDSGETETPVEAEEKVYDGPSITELLDRGDLSLYTPITIRSKVDREVAFILDEERLKLPGVVVEAKPLREYLEGALVSHILGYVGRIPSERQASYLDDPALGYVPDDLVGLMGIEYTQEELLKGTKGQKLVEVDAFQREVAMLAQEPPTQGYNLTLTIDVELQRAVEKALAEGMERAKAPVGVAIAMDPRTGELLAMSSLPTYDNNLFSGGISFEDYERLSSDRHHPLVNHAIGGQYAPGSVFKIITAAGALQEGVINRNTHFTCRGTLMLSGHPFYCWNRGGHGSLDVVQALAQSCNLFMHQAVGGTNETRGLGIEGLEKYMLTFGLGEPTGVDLAGETAGLVPNDRWKRHTFAERWMMGDTYNASIGQGFVLATPLQLLNAYAAIANGGTLYRPQLVLKVTDGEGNVIHSLTPEPIRQLDISPENIELVREGTRQTINGARGTARHLQIPGVVAAGKTGTAQYPAVDEEGNLILDAHGNLLTHAWFAAYAPYDNPEIVLIVFLEAGGEGSSNAVPVANEILRYYFGVEESPEPTAIPEPESPSE